MSPNAKSLNKVESLQKRALLFLYDNFDSSCESILKLAGKSTMNVNRLKFLYWNSQNAEQYKSSFCKWNFWAEED